MLYLTDMNINKIIFNEIQKVSYQYDLDIDHVKSFLMSKRNFEYLQKEAITIIGKIMAFHGKQAIADHLEQLAEIEYATLILQPHARDHVVHALRTFLLGIYINELFLGQNYPNKKVSGFQWKLAGLFHDIGYPLEISENILRSLFKKIVHTQHSILNNNVKSDNNILSQIGKTGPTASFFHISTKGIEKLTKEKNALNLIDSQLKRWELDIDVQKAFNEMSKAKTCHGILSSLMMLNIIDLVYDKYNPDRGNGDFLIPHTNLSCNQEYFINDIIPACTAIFLHNLDYHYFTNTKIDRNKAPIAFLLKLSDCLQDWERSTINNKKGYPSSGYQILIRDSKLFFSAPQDRKDKIMKELNATLLFSDIEIDI